MTLVASESIAKVLLIQAFFRRLSPGWKPSIDRSSGVPTPEALDTDDTALANTLQLICITYFLLWCQVPYKFRGRTNDGAECSSVWFPLRVEFSLERGRLNPCICLSLSWYNQISAAMRLKTNTGPWPLHFTTLCILMACLLWKIRINLGNYRNVHF